LRRNSLQQEKKKKVKGVFLTGPRPVKDIRKEWGGEVAERHAAQHFWEKELSRGLMELPWIKGSSKKQGISKAWGGGAGMGGGMHSSGPARGHHGGDLEDGNGTITTMAGVGLIKKNHMETTVSAGDPKRERTSVKGRMRG